MRASLLFVALLSCGEVEAQSLRNEPTNTPRSIRPSTPRTRDPNRCTYTEPPRFIESSINLTSGDLAVTAPITNAVQTQLTYAIWFRNQNSGWPNAVRGLLTKNASANRQFYLGSQTEGSTGQLDLGFGDGTTLTHGYIADDTFTGRAHSFLAVSFDNGVVTAVGDGYNLPIQGSPSWPSSLGASTAPLMIGATAVGSGRWQGHIYNVAVWDGFAANVAQMRAMWNEFDPVDYRTMGQGVPQPTVYVIGNGSSENVMGGGSVASSGVVTHDTGTLPGARRSASLQFTDKFLLNPANDQADGSYPAGEHGNYSMNASLVRLPDGSIMMAYSRGDGHTEAQEIYLARSVDEGRTWPISGRAYPGKSTTTFEEALPYGTLTALGSNRRGTALSLIPEIGTGGNSRLFIVFNETQVPVTDERTFWLMYNDSPTAALAGWSTPIELGDISGPGAGSLFNNVGKGHIIRRRSDGSLLLPYYYRDVGEGRYVTALMRSTNGGLTWTHWVDTMTDPSINGAQYEESYVDYLHGTDILYSQSRVDSAGNGTTGFTRDIVWSVSLDDGLTWSAPRKAYDGYAATVWADWNGIMVASNRYDSADEGAAYGTLEVSKDNGITWSTPVRYTDRSTDLVIYTDFIALRNGQLGMVWPQELTAGGSYLEFGTLRSCYLATLANQL